MRYVACVIGEGFSLIGAVQDFSHLPGDTDSLSDALEIARRAPDRWLVIDLRTREIVASKDHESCASRHDLLASEHHQVSGRDLHTECGDHPQLPIDVCDGVHCRRSCDGVLRMDCRVLRLDPERRPRGDR